VRIKPCSVFCIRLSQVRFSVIYSIANNKLNLYTSGLFNERFENCSYRGMLEPGDCGERPIREKKKKRINGPMICYVTTYRERDYHNKILKCLKSATWLGNQQQTYYLIIYFKTNQWPPPLKRAELFDYSSSYCLAIIGDSINNCEETPLVNESK